MARHQRNAIENNPNALEFDESNEEEKVPDKELNVKFEELAFNDSEDSMSDG